MRNPGFASALVLAGAVALSGVFLYFELTVAPRSTVNAACFVSEARLEPDGATRATKIRCDDFEFQMWPGIGFPEAVKLGDNLRCTTNRYFGRLTGIEQAGKNRVSDCRKA